VSEIHPLEPRNSLRIAGGAWYALSVITLIHACYCLDRAVIPNLVEPIRREFQLSDAQLGALTGLAYGVSFTLAGLPLAYLADRIDRRRMLSVLIVVWSALTACAAASQHYWTLLLTRLGVGAAEAGGAPAAISLVVDLFPARSRATALGIYLAGISIGALANAWVTAVIAAHHGWRWALLAAGAPGIALGLLAWATLEDVPRGSCEGPDPGQTCVNETFPAVPEIARLFLRQTALIGLIGAVALAGAGVSAIAAWLPALLMRTHGASLGEAGVLTALAFGLFPSVGTVAGGIIADRLARRARRLQLQFCAGGTLLAGLAGVGVATVTDLHVVAAAACLVAMSAFALLPTSYGVALGLMPPQVRALTSTVIQLPAALVGYGLGPYAVGLLSSALGSSHSLGVGIMIVNGVTMSLATLLLVVLSRRREIACGPWDTVRLTTQQLS
jgi:predicted MFS family arabinose efflux permease